MRTYLIFSILLAVPLVFASLPASLTSKLLYDGGFSISDNFDGRYTHLDHFNGRFSYIFKNNASRFRDYLDLKRRPIRKQFGFALETWPGEYAYNNVTCFKESEPILRDWIRDCWGNIRIRQLTDEERAEVQRFKDAYKETKKPFIVIHDDKRVKIKAIRFDLFVVTDYVDSRYGYHDFTVYHDDSRRDIWLQDKMINKSFVVEALPDGTEVNCKETDVQDIYLGRCAGPIRLRRINGDDL